MSNASYSSYIFHARIIILLYELFTLEEGVATVECAAYIYVAIEMFPFFYESLMPDESAENK